MLKNLLAIAVAATAFTACESMNSCNSGDGSATPGSKEDFMKNVGDSVYFHFDSAAITDQAQKRLEGQSAWLKVHDCVTATVAGHTDSRGTAAYNMVLGKHRAEAVKKALTDLCVDESRLSTISYGKSKPVVKGAKTEAQHAQNRVAVTELN